METKLFYEAPKVEVIDVEVEKGFAASEYGASGYGNGGSYGWD